MLKRIEYAFIVRAALNCSLDPWLMVNSVNYKLRYRYKHRSWSATLRLVEKIELNSIQEMK